MPLRPGCQEPGVHAGADPAEHERHADDTRLTDDLTIHVASAGKEPEPRRVHALEDLAAWVRTARLRTLVLPACLLAVLGHFVWTALHAPEFAAEFGERGLVTNEYAAAHPRAARARRSDQWLVTSGSLFARDGWGWTGRPDDVPPGPASRRGTDSAVFRAVTVRDDFRDVEVSFDVRNIGFTTTPRTPAHAWDGINLILRWQADDETYYVSLGRRDGTVLIKKKVPGGDVNGGWYYPLTQSIPHRPPFGQVQHYVATITDDPDGAVTIKLFFNGRLLLHANDDGVGGPPLTRPGRVGLRGDNDEFLFRDFVVRSTSWKEAGRGPTRQAPSDGSIRRRDGPAPGRR